MDMEKEIKILNLDDILPNRFQPRIQFSDKNINELADSIKEHGVIQPIVVRKVSDKYEIIAGERRYKASILAGKTTIPAIITNLDDKNSAEIALIENVQRQDLTPIEEAVSYKKILDMGYLTQNDLAEKLGKTQSTIANKLRLLNLDDEVQEALLDGKISERHARSLLKLDNSHQIIMLNRIINERLTVRKTDEEIDKMIKSGIGNNIEEIKESEGEHMDEKIMSEFNIPNNPIIEETVIDQLDKQVENINPGFMDIEKIENNAEDIFKDMPAVNLDMLLEKPVEPVVKEEPMSVMQPVIETEEDSTPKGGRFFNMFGFNQEEDTNPNYVSDLEKKETNMDFGIPTPNNPTFNPFDLNNTIENSNIEENKNQEVLEENQNSMMQPEISNIDSNIFNSNNSTENEFNINNELFNSNFENSINPINDLNLNSEIENKEEINDSFDINDNNQIESNILPVEESNYDFSFQPNENNEDSFAPLNSYNLNDEEEFATNKKEIVEPITEQNLFENIVQPNEEISNFQQQEESQNITPIYDDIIEEPKLDSIPIISGAADFRTVINTIRNCSKTIEKYGFKIETEEIDFEDSYQVIFKIDKK